MAKNAGEVNDDLFIATWNAANNAREVAERLPGSFTTANVRSRADALRKQGKNLKTMKRGRPKAAV